MFLPACPRPRAFAVTAALLVFFPASLAQSSEAEELRLAREEIAALRQQVAELQAQVARAPAAPAAQPATTPAESRMPAKAADSRAAALLTDEGVTALSPFQVNSERDRGYLKTNSATATRIGMEVQKIPLNISILSEDFIKDTGMREISDVLRYSAAAAGDTRQVIKPPGNNVSPSGTFTLRGFPISSRLRNGLSRFSYYNMDTVERIEIIKGPAAVFFGLGHPGGVINYVTKQPEFAPRPTTFSHSYGGNTDRMGAQRASLDENTMFSKQAAMRLIAVWDDAIGSQRGEFKHAFTIAPSIAVVPFASRKLRLNAEFEYARIRQNSDAQGWIYPDQWFADFKSPTPALLAAAGVTTAGVVGTPLTVREYQDRIMSNVMLWIQDVRRVQQGNNLALGFDANDNYVPQAPLWTSLRRGAKYTRSDGTRIYDRAFNNRGVGSQTDQTDSTVAVTAEADPTPWFNLRYTFSRNTASYRSLFSQAMPYADGIRMNFSGPSARGDRRDSKTHQYDFVFTKEFFRVKNKILIGGVYDHSLSSFYGNSGYLYANIPGAALAGTGPLPNLVNTATLPFIPASIMYPGSEPGLPNVTMQLASGGNAVGTPLQLQQLYSRTDVPLTATQVFSEFDPGVHPVPDIRRITGIDRGIIDRSHPKKEEYYLNYLASLFDDRLNLFAGYRTTKTYDGDQRVSPNPPWFYGFENMLETLTTKEQQDRYGISGIVYATTLRVQEGHSWMAGVSYALTKDLTVYVSSSQSFLPNPGTLADIDERAIRDKAPSLELDPNTEMARLLASGATTPLKNEQGLNYEFGVKTSLADGKLTGTFSVFRLLRRNEKLDDAPRQFAEPLSYDGPNKAGISRILNGLVRWYSNSSVRKVEGTEAELIWSPRRNYQMLANVSWLWTARTTADPRYFDPANPPATATAQQRQTNSQFHYFTYQFRMQNVPEYRFNTFHKYTFTEGPARGLSLTLGARYASVMNIFNTIDADSKRGGVTAGDYLVFDGGASFPWEIFRFKVGTSLQISNLTNREYNEGSGSQLGGGGYMNSPPRTWQLTNTVKF